MYGKCEACHLSNTQNNDKNNNTQNNMYTHYSKLNNYTKVVHGWPPSKAVVLWDISVMLRWQYFEAMPPQARSNLPRWLASLAIAQCHLPMPQLGFQSCQCPRSTYT